jgi:hypothetical protein
LLTFLKELLMLLFQSFERVQLRQQQLLCRSFIFGNLKLPAKRSWFEADSNGSILRAVIVMILVLLLFVLKLIIVILQLLRDAISPDGHAAVEGCARLAVTRRLLLRLQALAQ